MREGQKAFFLENENMTFRHRPFPGLFLETETCGAPFIKDGIIKMIFPFTPPTKFF